MSPRARPAPPWRGRCCTRETGRGHRFAWTCGRRGSRSAGSSATTSRTSCGASAPRRGCPCRNASWAGAVVDLVDLPSRNRRELARVALHRLGRRFSGVGGVDASVFGVLRHVERRVRSRHLERYVAERAGARRWSSARTRRDGRAPFHVVRTGVDEPGPLAPPDDPYAIAHFVLPGSFHYPPHQDACRVVRPVRHCRRCVELRAGVAAMVFAGPVPGLDALLRTVARHRGDRPARRPGRRDRRARRGDRPHPCRVGHDHRGRRGLGAGRAGGVDQPRASKASTPTTARTCSSPTTPRSSPPRARWRPAYPDLRSELATNGRARYEAEFTWAADRRRSSPTGSPPAAAERLVAWACTGRRWRSNRSSTRWRGTVTWWSRAWSHPTRLARRTTSCCTSWKTTDRPVATTSRASRPGASTACSPRRALSTRPRPPRSCSACSTGCSSTTSSGRRSASRSAPARPRRCLHHDDASTRCPDRTAKW